MTHLAQFEQWVPAPIERVFLFFTNPGNLPRMIEIAEALGVNVNTVYWRQRTARQEFEKILRRPQKSEAGSTR